MWLVGSIKFDRFIMACILLNSVCMGLFDYREDNFCAYKYKLKECPAQHTSLHNKVLGWLGFGFSVIFTIEAGIKIFALGFIHGRKTYLKSYWNVLDFVIVIAGIIEIVMQ